MDSFESYFLRKASENVRKNGDRLAIVDGLIDWEAFRPIIRGLYDNQSPKGGRPNMDEVVIVKILVLQQWYGISDPAQDLSVFISWRQLDQRQVDDRLSFQRFLGFPGKVPDYSTV